MYALKEKLKMLREKLRGWNKEVFGKIGSKYSEYCGIN